LPASSKRDATEDLVARVEVEQVRHVDLQYTDVIGGVKTVTIPASQLGQAIAHGVWFDGSSVDSLARTAESDMYLIPDPSTFQVLPWGQERTARLICWATTPDGEPYAGDPRGVLRRAIEDAQRLGFEYRVGPEIEFFLLERGGDGALAPTRSDRSSYFDFSSDGNTDLRQRMVSALMSMGIAVNTSHHEIAGGQHEIDIDASPALKAADDVITFRYALKAVAAAIGSHRDLHAQALRRPAGERHARPSKPGERPRLRQLVRRRGCLRAQQRRAALHRRAAAPRGRDQRGPRAAGELLQAPGSRLRGADLHLVGAHQPRRAHPGAPCRSRRGHPRGAAQP